MILIFSILISVFMILFCFWYCKNEKSIFNHVSIFSMGFFLYLVMPILVGEMGIVSGNELFATFNYLYERISIENKIFYLTFILVTYLGFVFGNLYHFKTKKTKTKKINFDKIKTFIENKKINSKTQIVLGILLFLLSLVYVIKFWPYFFTGYTHDVNRGMFAALILVDFAFVIITDLNIYLSEKNWKKAIFNIYNLIFLILNVLLLSLGTRMYFIAVIFTVLVVLEQFVKFDKKKIIILFLGLFGFVGLVGILRSNYTVSLSNSILTNLMEFLYTFISSLKFMQLGINKLINFPIFLASHFINLVPTVIFPDKLSYVLNYADFGYVIYSPQGALSLYVELTTNFGLIGSFIVAFCMGYFLEFLRKNRTKTICLVIYSLLCGFIGFSLFRDGFPTSIIKNILEFSLIIPLIFYVILTFKFRRKNEKNISD